MLRELFEQVLTGYSLARAAVFTDHPFRKVLKQSLPEALKAQLEWGDRYVVKGSAGLTQWTHCPWVAVLDKLITHTPQRGYYPVYLFQADLQGFYLSLNQGITDLRQEYKSGAAKVLQVRAADYLAKVGKVPNGFEEGTIELRAPKGSDPSFYDYGSIFSKYYSKDALPADNELVADLKETLRIYSWLVEVDSVEVEADPLFSLRAAESSDEFFEDVRKRRYHARIERNGALVRQVKKVRGYECEVCSFNFKKVYGDLGDEFIEAHHLTPISSLTGRVGLDPMKDFAVLCPNCHRMIHRLDDVSDLDLLKRVLQM
jgi:5-methylcytosine-specific restriction protein A